MHQGETMRFGEIWIEGVLKHDLQTMSTRLKEQLLKPFFLLFLQFVKVKQKQKQKQKHANEKDYDTKK